MFQNSNDLGLHELFFGSDKEHIDLIPPANESNHYTSLTTGTSYNEETKDKTRRINNKPNKNLSNDNLPANTSDKKNQKPRKKSDSSSKETTKQKRELGIEYLGYRREGTKIYHDVPRAERKLGPNCTSNQCRRASNRFCSNFSEADRLQIFTMLWKQSTWGQRKTFVVNHVHMIDTKRSYTVNPSSRRSATFNYFLTLNKEKLQVCKKMFLSTTGLKEFSVLDWVKADKYGLGVKTKTKI